jgi:trimeric autotransporter adhesin
MKKIKHFTALASMLFFGALCSVAQNVGIGITTPDPSAQLDITAINKGLLIPRVSLTSLSDAVTIPSPANSLLVYNTNAALSGGVGFYYNSGKGSAIWVKLLSGAGGGSGWGLTGNAATDSTANFLGTTDLKPLVFRVNNGFAGQISSIGGISLGRAANGTTRIADPSVIAIGDSALFFNRGNSEIAIGNGALYSNTTGQSNTAVGNFNLGSNTTGSANVAVGHLSLLINDTANYNTSVGFRSLLYTVADENTAVGARSMENNFSGFYNTAMGGFSLFTNDNGIGNTGLGDAALYTNNVGDVNTAVGLLALYYMEGSENTAVGYNAIGGPGPGATTGYSNSAFGSDALSNLIAGNFNTAIGDSASYSLTTGNFNTAVGYLASSSLTTGNFNTTVGYLADVTPGNLINATAIGYNAKVSASNTISIGNAAVTSIKGAVNFTTFSDGRYKKDVSEDVRGIDFIMQLRPVTYHYDFDKINTDIYSIAPSSDLRKNFLNRKSAINISARGLNGKAANMQSFSPALNLHSPMSNLAKKSVSPDLTKYYEEVKQNNQKRYTGFIAQEVEAVAKKMGFEFSGVDKPKNEKDQYGLRYAEFVVPLVKAVQEQQAIINSQNKKIDDLIKRIETLEAAKQ